MSGDLGKKVWEYGDSLLDMIITTDLDRNITEFNRAAQETYGYTREEAIGQPASILHAEDTDGRALRQRVLEPGAATQEIQARRKNGQCHLALVSASLLRDENGLVLGVTAISRDITDLKRIEAELRNLSWTDELTGLYNRRGFLALGEQHWKWAHRTRYRSSSLWPPRIIDVRGKTSQADRSGLVVVLPPTRPIQVCGTVDVTIFSAIAVPKR